ncbi:hypothetical protein [Paracoccus denitrificans]|jgi:hypothetical protein|uniref:hypothetical protein n=1 Tax=Paracoccus denitrificans TaxID=266 RepID=UPI000325AB09|nr:hypothetical protein [Paracoccus denitrificans]MBB4625780.1 hypothetical protein [Paracoccus denitrificans]MCU7427055.1 hypothetical protein [Paracoccus denitrificans]QAR26572.1 hypothetical protein EO213_09835 [Paracoccus denitrificans]UPV95515.1 hypothetical protein M0K93_02675 [Paracoccus denitrificans]WQO32419.1 hypothetical protein U0005_08760 [Paracoccus denitrificans]
MTDTIDHTRKVNRAVAMCSIGMHPESVAAMLRAIPEDVIAALPARLIAQLIDANWRLAGASKAIAAADAIREGCVWDAQQGRHRDIAA